MARRIAVLLFDGVEELDFAGPWEVFAAWADQFPDDGIEVQTLATTLDAVRCAKGPPQRARAQMPAVPPRSPPPSTGR